MESASSIGHQYLMALADGRADDAWFLMAPAARQSVSQQEHRRRVDGLTQQQRATLRTWSAHVQQGEGQRVWQQDSLSLQMSQTGTGHWIVTKPLAILQGVGSARNALLAFHNAFTNRDFAAMIRFAPSNEQTKLSVQLIKDRFSDAEFVHHLERALDALTDKGIEVVQEGDRWLFESGRYMAILKRETHRWRIIDVR